MRKINLISDWKHCLRFVSVQANIILTGVAGAWLIIPDDMRAAVPDYLLAGCAIVLAVIGGIGRIVKQNIRKRDDAKSD